MRPAKPHAFPGDGAERPYAFPGDRATPPGTTPGDGPAPAHASPGDRPDKRLATPGRQATPPRAAHLGAEAGPPPPAATADEVAGQPLGPSFRTTRAYMDTRVTITIVAPGDDPACAAAAERAFGWFAEVEARCSRFDPGSELRRLADQPPGLAVPVSPLLFEAVRFACAVAERSGGAFDPAIGARQQARGLVRNYRTGLAEPWLDPGGARPAPDDPTAAAAGPCGAAAPAQAPSPSRSRNPAARGAMPPPLGPAQLAGTGESAGPARPSSPTDPAGPPEPAGPVQPSGPPQPAGPAESAGQAQPSGAAEPAGPDEPFAPSAPADPTWRDLVLDRAARTITLRRPLLLDLGAVAKGMAIDLAARELAAAFRDFLVEAGGDVYAGGRGPAGRPWRVAVRHPRAHDAYSAVLAVSDAAVCSSGDYARPAADGGHHILDPRTARSAGAATACTVLAPSAMLADALATAAFVLGPRAGIDWLAREGAEGLILAADLQPHATSGLRRHRGS